MISCLSFLANFVFNTIEDKWSLTCEFVSSSNCKSVLQEFTKDAQLLCSNLFKSSFGSFLDSEFCAFQPTCTPLKSLL